MIYLYRWLKNHQTLAEAILVTACIPLCVYLLIVTHGMGVHLFSFSIFIIGAVAFVSLIEWGIWLSARYQKQQDAEASAVFTREVAAWKIEEAAKRAGETIPNK